MQEALKVTPRVREALGGRELGLQGKAPEKETSSFLSNLTTPAGATEHVSYIQDETIPGYSETEQTISDEEIHDEPEERPAPPRFPTNAYDLPGPEDPGPFEVSQPADSVVPVTSSKGYGAPETELTYPPNIVPVSSVWGAVSEATDWSSATDVAKEESLSHSVIEVAEDTCSSSAKGEPGAWSDVFKSFRRASVPRIVPVGSRASTVSKTIALSCSGNSWRV